MCGITGILAFDDSPKRQDIRMMTDSLAYRGPDDADTWIDGDAGIALGHRRLSIIDLSPLGRQPMHSACERYVMVFNGEVYNFPELRQELEGLGHFFRGGSDSEVMLTAISQWGLMVAVKQFVGMFAIALWDRWDRSLSLVRDRMGIKPLYYGWAGRQFVFGSELKALRKAPNFSGEIDRDALTLFFRHNYIPAPWTAYRNARKLEPGNILTLRNSDVEPDIQPFWSALDVWNHGAANPFDGNMTEAELELESLLEEAVRIRMISDVPLGALLSGGIDSSTIVALMQKNTSQPVKTFSIGFHEAEYNEAQHAKAVAEHLGTDHTELYITPKDMLNVIPAIPKHWDEPFSDSSQIPTYLVSKLTRDHVTVALSGDGGDELFAGYERYFLKHLWDRISKVPLWLRHGVTPLVRSIPWQAFGLLGSTGFKIRWRLDMLAMNSFADFYRYFLGHHKHPTNLVLGGNEPVSPMTADYAIQFDDHFRKMTFWDTKAYLPDDILTKTDRASMAHALELRVPLLDHRVAEFAATLPTEYKVQDRAGKQVLRNLLYKYVPKKIVERPKMGFGVPVREWLEGDLKEWCLDLLNLDRIRQQGYLSTEEVGGLTNRFYNGEIMWCHHLWDILMFQAWLEEWEH